MATTDQCHLEAASAPAECSLEASNVPLECHLEVLNAPVIAEWYLIDGTQTHLGCKHGNTGTKVVADIRLNSSRSTALFDIRVPVELKAFARTTHLHLLIDPLNVKAVAQKRIIPDVVQSPFVGNNPSGHVVGLEFDMMKPASLLGPTTARVPKNKKAREVFERLKSLAQVVKFTLYAPCQNISQSQVQTLVSVLSEGHNYRANWPGLNRTYGGKGAVLLEWDTLENTSAPDDASPPSYNQIGPAPPLPLDDKISLKQPRRDPSPEADRSQKKVKFVPVSVPGDIEEDEDDEEHSWKQQLQDEIRSLRGELKTLREEVTPSSIATQGPNATLPNDPAAESIPTTTESTSTTTQYSKFAPKHLEVRIDTLENRINSLEDRIISLSDQLSRLISDTDSTQVSNTQQIADLKKHFDERIDAIEYMLDAEVQDARRDSELGLNEAEDRWDEWRVGAKAELQSFVEEEMAQVEESIRQSLRQAGREGMEATVYFDFE